MKRVGVHEMAGALTLVDDVYERIHNAIVTGELNPGQQIKQIPLSDSLGVSQRTVREALMRIAAEGLIDHEPRKGFRVASFPFDELEEIYQMRCLLEGFAVEAAATIIQPDELTQMRELLPATVATKSSAAALDTHEANRRFHMMAIRASGKRHLIRILGQLWRLMFTQYGGEEDAETLAAVSQRELQEHEQLLEALGRRDGSGARRVVEQHIEATLTNLKKNWVENET